MDNPRLSGALTYAGVDAKPCPFCGSDDLCLTDWFDIAEGRDAIECNNCKGCAPFDVWNQRAAAEPDQTQDLFEETIQ